MPLQRNAGFYGNQIEEGPDTIVSPGPLVCLKASAPLQICIEAGLWAAPKTEKFFTRQCPCKTGLQDAPKTKKYQFFVAKNGTFS